MFKRKNSDTSLVKKSKSATKRSKSVAEVASSPRRNEINQNEELRSSSDSLKSIKKRGGNKYLSKVKRLNAEQVHSLPLPPHLYLSSPLPLPHTTHALSFPLARFVSRSTGHPGG